MAQDVDGEGSGVGASPAVGVRSGALAAGLLAAMAVAAGLPYGEFLVKGTRFGISSSTPGAFFLLLVVLLGQPLAGRLCRRWMLGRHELLLLVAMTMLASALATRGFTGVFVGVIAAPYYYASQTNSWAARLHPHLPAWIAPRDPQALEWFFEGLPPGERIPWEAWWRPLAWWGLFMAALCAVAFCLMVILRRQWAEHERLPYPLMQLPEAMTEGAAAQPQPLLEPFLRNPLMWIGFGVPFLIHTFNAVASYRSGLSAISLVSASVPLFRHTVSLQVTVNYLVLGLAYLINTGVAFSMWFFFLLAQVQVAVYTLLGVSSSVQLDSCSYRGPVASIMSHQALGAMFVLVAGGLWSARVHLREVARQAWRGGGDSAERELMSYRAAVATLACGLAVMVAWLAASGLPLWATALFLAAAFTVYLALTRVIVEAGLVTAIQGLTGAGFLLSGVGSSALGAKGLLGLGFTMPWAGDHMSFLMAPVANCVRLLQGVPGRRRIALSLAAAIGIGLVVSVGTTLTLAYRHGAATLEGQYFSWFAQEPFRVAVVLLDQPSGPYASGWRWLGQGAAAMAVLTWLRQRVLWWPLHPLGFAVGGTWLLQSAWFSIFVAWAVKVVVLRYGGVRAYRTSRWVFLGMFLGHVAAGGVWLLIGAAAGVRVGALPMY